MHAWQSTNSFDTTASPGQIQDLGSEGFIRKSEDGSPSLGSWGKAQVGGLGDKSPRSW